MGDNGVPCCGVRDLGILALLAHIEPDRYTILAVDLTVDGPASATVYAFDRAEHGTSLHAEIIELGRSRGEVPVVPFDVPAPNVEDFIRQAFKRISVRFVTQTLRDQVLVVAEPSATEDIEA